MSKNELGTPRRSHCLGNMGPGAIAEFRAGGTHGAAVSAVVAGLDEWPGTRGALEQVINEPRLEKLLDVREFRLPPVDPEGDWKKRNGREPDGLKAVRFPNWLQCPRCGALKRTGEWQHAIGDPARHCGMCSAQRNKVHVVPVRFIVTCPNGHLQEFPWHKWVQHKAECNQRSLRLTQREGAGLAGLILECSSCRASRSMEGALGRETMQRLRIPCRGERPWLGPNALENCTENPRAVQRGASNLYFPVTASALSIPPFTGEAAVAVQDKWRVIFSRIPEERWHDQIVLLGMEQELGMTAEVLMDRLRRIRQAIEGTNTGTLRTDEFEVLSTDHEFGEDPHFEVRHEPVPLDLVRYFDRLVRVVRLREVRALRGFTRIDALGAEAGGDPPRMARLSRNRLSWLPATEVRGEGIFLRFNASTVREWEERNREVLAERARQVRDAWHANSRGDAERAIDHRLLLVHSFSHALMRRLTLTSGYSSSSLRERLYVGDRPEGLGVLIFTGSADSDGSLGGLERQGRPERMQQLMRGAIRDMQWCSNDPICIQDIATFSEGRNLAACHACLLAPETSCEEFNVLLDRALLVGRPEDPGLGFFAPLLTADADI